MPWEAEREACTGAQATSTCPPEARGQGRAPRSRMGLQEAGSREEGHRPPTSRAVELGPAGTWWNPRLRRRTSACRLEVPRLKAILCKRKLSKS